MSHDYNKAICVPAGSDLLESIEGVGATSKWTLDKVRHVYTTHFPQVNDKINSLQCYGKSKNLFILRLGISILCQ